uniref:Putative secreted protein n=1 Tax=Ixodes ricinus TaxID=34613 RepID=A0A6B0UGN2_IXORI
MKLAFPLSILLHVPGTTHTLGLTCVPNWRSWSHGAPTALGPRVCTTIAGPMYRIGSLNAAQPQGSPLSHASVLEGLQLSRIFGRSVPVLKLHSSDAIGTFRQGMH